MTKIEQKTHNRIEKQIKRGNTITVANKDLTVMIERAARSIHAVNSEDTFSIALELQYSFDLLGHETQEIDNIKQILFDLGFFFVGANHKPINDTVSMFYAGILTRYDLSDLVELVVMPLR